MRGFENQAMFRARNQTVELNGSPQQIRSMLVTPSWVKLLRVSPALGRPFLEEEGEIGRDQKVILSQGLWQQLSGGVKRTLYLLWGGALLVLLIGGLNIANLALARLALRRKELATRIALGASRVQILRQLILENLGLALLGGLGGIALGAGVLRTLNAIGLEHFPRASEVRMDSAAVLVSLALSLGAGLFVGLVPLASISKIGISDALHEDSRTGT